MSGPGNVIPCLKGLENAAEHGQVVGRFLGQLPTPMSVLEAKEETRRLADYTSRPALFAAAFWCVTVPAAVTMSI